MSAKVRTGQIFSEVQFYTVVKTAGDKVQLINANKENIVVGQDYIDKCLQSADTYGKEEKLSQTDIINIIIAHPRTACSIYFKKQDKEKTKKAYNEEKAKKIEQIKNAKVSEVEALLSNLIDNPILNIIPGEMRLIKGYHSGTQDERGRINFIDMEDTTISVPKAVDPRTVEYVIINNTKYLSK